MKTKLFYIIGLLCLSIVVQAQQRIIGGSTANITERPYQAAIYVNGTFNGGGVIIGSRWILTAAHVVRNQSADKIQIYTGYTNLNNATTRSAAKRVIIHNKYEYNPTSDWNDIALIELMVPLQLNVAARKAINISTSTSYSKGTVAVTSGWGFRSTNGSASTSQLYKTNVTIQSCNNQVIIAEPSNNMPFRGDSGGPLTISTSSGDLLIGIVDELDDASNPTSGKSYYTNVGAYYDWILQNADIYSEAIDGPDLVCGTATFTVSPYPQNCQLEYSPNIEVVSQSNGSVTIRAKYNGRGYITMDVGSSSLAGHKYFWVGAPAVTGVTSNGSYLKAETAGLDAGITHTDWTVGSNHFTSSSATLACPYSSGTYNVTVTATNSCGTGNTYRGQVTISNSRRYTISIMSGSRQVTVTPIDNVTANQAIAATPIQTTNMTYILAALQTGTIAETGTLSQEGGTLNFSNVPAGLYVLKLLVEEGIEESFKISLK